MITLKKLKEIEACEKGQQAFLDAFPKGKVSNKVFFKTLKENSAQLTYDQKSYLGWLAENYPGLNFKERKLLVEQSDSPKYRACSVASWAVGLTDEEREQLKEMSK